MTDEEFDVILETNYLGMEIDISDEEEISTEVSEEEIIDNLISKINYN